MGRLRAVEICAGAGGQTLGLHLAGFDHQLAVELDPQAAETLLVNLARLRDEPVDHVQKTAVAVGDVADVSVWDPKRYPEPDLLAGGVPCPPFSLAGRQLGAQDERDLFAWAVELAAQMRPKAVLLENVRGLAGARFSGYRQAVADRLHELGYWSEWCLLHAVNFDVPQLRPRFILVALAPEYAPFFRWPMGAPTTRTVGGVLGGLMAEGGWEGAASWAQRANGIAPTIVGGSKRHGGADLGPTRAKLAWQRLHVDAHGVADAPPDQRRPRDFKPKLTCEMVARLQGWDGDEYRWDFTGRKTSRYRQIGNAFPPPMARGVGEAIKNALDKVPVDDSAQTLPPLTAADHDLVYRVLRRAADEYLTADQIAERIGFGAAVDVERRIDLLRADFEVEEVSSVGGRAFRIAEFKAFRGQPDHVRRAAFTARRKNIS